MRKTIGMGAVVLLSVAVIAGCTTQQKGAGIGAGAGAVIGGVIGHQSGNTAAGVAIGAAIGGLGGYVVGDVIEERKTRSEEETRIDYGYGDQDDPFLDVKEVRVRPLTAGIGSTVENEMTFAVLGESGIERDIRETTLLRVEDTSRVIQENESLGQFSSGTYRVTREFEVPADAAPGNYTLVKELDCAGCQVATATTTFYVAKK